MRLFRTFAPIVGISVLSGCGYIHFGKLPPEKAGDAALQRAYADLSLEHKILRRELELARQEKDTLQAALERGGGAASGQPATLARQLEEANRELAALRTAQAQAASSAAAGQPSPAASPTLAQENTRLREALAAARAENAALAEKLKGSVEQNLQAQASLSHLNAELLGQKQARERAEQVTASLRAQLEAVMARAGRAENAGSAPAGPKETPPGAGALAGLQSAKAPPSGAVPAVELRTTLDRARGVSANSTAVRTAVAPEEAVPDTPPAAAPQTVPATPAPPAPKPSEPRTYTVQQGDTLEKIAIRMYGAAEHWGKIYEANSEALGANQGIKPGMKLVVPEP